MDEMEGYSVDQVLAATAGELFQTVVLIGDKHQRLIINNPKYPGCPGLRANLARAQLP